MHQPLVHPLACCMHVVAGICVRDLLYMSSHDVRTLLRNSMIDDHDAALIGTHSCAADESWGAWECLECVNVNLFVSVSVRVVTHMWQGCDSPLVAGLRLATRGRVATRHLWQGCDSPHMLHKHDDINCVRAMIPVNRQQCKCIHLMQR